MRAFLILPLLLLTALPVWADARMTVLVDLLKLPEAVEILHDENQTYAQQLHADMLSGNAGAGWQVQVEAILDKGRMVETLRRALEAALNDEQIDAAIAFFASDLGREVINLENSARAAISSKDVEEAARGRYAEIAGSKDGRLLMLTDFVEGNDMIGRNVTSAMNANFQFLRGLAEGGAVEMSEEEMLASVGSDLEEITQDTTSWLYGYMLMAFHPLKDEALQRYIAFSLTPAGQAINNGLFNGFGASYAETSYALGRAVSLNMTAEEL